MGARAQQAASPAQSSKYTPPVLSFGGFSTSRAGEAELGQQRRVLQRPGGSRRYSPARPSSSGVSGCENREAQSSIQDVSYPPSSGLVETPSGGCGKDGFFLRLSLNYRYNSAAVLLSCGVVRSLPASYGWVCSVLQVELSARPQNTAICNGSPSLFQAFGYAPRLRRVSRLRRGPLTPPSGVQLFISGV